jgi:predicted metalloprotease with PDZ domain
MKYSISYTHPEKHFIDFKVSISLNDEDEIILQLPSWRPGRYELANFSKNIKDFKVSGNGNSPISFEKINKDAWKIITKNLDIVEVSYSYYAADLNAGSTYLSEEQLYINPVNCMMYVDSRNDSPIELKFKIDQDYEIYSSLKKESKDVLKAINFDELADSPIIASNTVQHKVKKIEGVDFNFCFQGEVKIDWVKIFNDFEKFIKYQIKQFGNFPYQEFYFLFQITPFNAYHGVEHHRSTVILLGSSYDVFGKLYNELLGVSSHELYHVWNVKLIRPSPMHPYDFSKENYTHMGYVAEGVTTYMGDRILYESKVFSKTDYFKELKTLLIRHFHNDGRKHYSVAESSWDTWLDGYVPGAPGRKVSIYVEGALIAMICDAKIREKTNGEKTLHDVMRKLYSGSVKETSYDKNNYKSILEEVSGFDFSEIFNKLVYGKNDFTEYLKNAFQFFGWTFDNIPSKNILFQYGIKSVLKKDQLVIVSILENSAAYSSGLAIGDKLIGINGYYIENNLQQWINYFSDEKLVLDIERNKKMKEIKLSAINNNQYFDYLIKDI